MKDAVLTIRVPLATRRRLQALARREGRSLSAQAERLIEQGLDPQAVAAARRGVRPLAGALHGGAVPALAEFRAARRALTTALRRRTRGRAEPRR
ncbi:MAG: ribbon-helix-helix protein, CopG family [Candidatus Rokubacteria bacterium]|nr:ribbon-helix-helix protein, CopG family [Candidatus Rokubacteria bacterium]